MFVFYFLIIIGLIILWFLLTFAFKPIGKFLFKVFSDTKNTLIEKEDDKNE